MHGKGTDSSNCPTLIICDMDGEARILGTKLGMLTADDSLTTSSSIDEHVGNSCV